MGEREKKAEGRGGRRADRREAKNQRDKDAKMRMFASVSGLDALPVGWDSNRYTINIVPFVPNVKSFLIICSIHEQNWS